MKNELQINELTTLEIIDLAYSTQDEDKYWNLVGELHKRGTELEFQEAKKLCEC